MTDRIFTDANGRKYINNEPRLHPPQRKPLTIKEINALPEAKGYWPMSMNDRIVRLIRAIEQAHGVKGEA